MMKFLFAGAFILGAVAILWIGRIFLGADTLGLMVTLLIAAVYAIGTVELLQFRRATDSLESALHSLSAPIEDFSKWLSTLPSSLQNSVRIRVEGERNGLPAPVMTPYLVGLLVMLGLLGTFVGMVDTLKGAVGALEGNNELEAIRAGLTAPIAGLGLAFGTSVAGVAASAMLGLLSTLARRERVQTSQLLDSKVATDLRQFSNGHKQQLAFEAIQTQAEALPELVEKMGQLATNLTAMSGKISDSLHDNQTQFQASAAQMYADLNSSIDESLKAGLVQNAEVLSASIKPMTESTLKELGSLSEATLERLNLLGEQQQDLLRTSVNSNSELVQSAVDKSLKQQLKGSSELIEKMQLHAQESADGLKQSSKSLLSNFDSFGEKWGEQQVEFAGSFSTVIREELAQLRKQEQQRGDAAVERLNELQNTLSKNLSTLGQGLEEPMSRLIETASEAPKAAAEVIEQLRGEVGNNLERENSLLAERTGLMQQLDSLAKNLADASLEQRQAIDALIERSSQTLDQVGKQFGQQLEGESVKLAGAVEHVASSSIEIASLGEAFNAAVSLFSDSNNSLIENLNRIEASLEQSSSRSDEQLAYYVAQAREIIDHNLLSHQQIIAALKAQKPTQLSVDEVAS